MTHYFNPPVPRGTGLCAMMRLLTALQISIHPSLAGRDPTYQNNSKWYAISIHPSLAGRDVALSGCELSSCQFQSTRPSRDGTIYRPRTAETGAISIHPSLAGRDLTTRYRETMTRNFNPPVPRGTGRNRFGSILSVPSYFNPPVPRGTGQITVCIVYQWFRFQSTRPSRDGTISQVKQDMSDK